jgi:O-antigen ligase
MLPMDEDAQDKQSIDVLYYLALKRHEALDRSFDALNSRAGVLLGFSGFVLTAFSGAISVMHGAGGYRIAALLIILTLFLITAWHCAKAYDVTKTKTLPDPKTFYEKFINSPPKETKNQLLAQLIENWRLYSVTITEKSRALRAAIGFFTLELFVIAILMLLVYSQESNKGSIAVQCKCYSGMVDVANLDGGVR